MRFASLFFGYLVAELCSIIFLAQAVGAGWTILILIGSFFMGLFMLRNIGFSKVLILGSLWNSNNNPSLYQVLWPVRFILAAVFLMIPGLVSDFLALLLMIPVKGPKLTQNQFYYSNQQQPQKYESDGDVIEGEYSEVDPKHETHITPKEYLPKNK